jgi:oxygen-independent coproporphyrinogen-3 oxidase
MTSEKQKWLTLNALPEGQQARFGFYFHVPFCPHICPYCDFVKTSRFSSKGVKTFFSKCLTQLKELLNDFTAKDVHCTVYFGGGTPGLFPASYYAEILELISKRFIIEECTIETNPFTNAKSKLAEYRNAGFNRITLGVQSLHDATLQTLGRHHTAAQALQNVAWAREVGFDEVQTDLIYGLAKGLRPQGLHEEIQALVKCGATGISAYALSLEERTHFAKSGYADDDIAADEYEVLYQEATGLGMRQLETSNFSFFEARHNNIYWYGQPYFGIGTGAHGLLLGDEHAPYGVRYKVGDLLSERAPGDDSLEFESQADKLFQCIYEPARTRSQFIDEMIFTALRTPQGLQMKWLQEFIAVDMQSTLEKDEKVSKALSSGGIFFDEAGLRLDWREKIRGDYWAAHFCSMLNDNSTRSRE